MALTVLPGIAFGQDPQCPYLEDVENLAPDWTFEESGAGTGWAAVPAANAKSGGFAFFTEATAANSSKDVRLISPPFDLTSASQLNFWHAYSIEAQFDGGVLEVSTDGGTSWADVGVDSFIAGGYNQTLDTGTVLDGRKAWSGTSGTYPTMVPVEVDVGSFAGSARQFSWRLVTDSILGEVGWHVDDIELINLLGCARTATSDTGGGSQPQQDNGGSTSVGGGQQSASGSTAETGIESSVQIGIGSLLLLLALGAFALSRRAPARR
jgi:hypothetical protein